MDVATLSQVIEVLRRLGTSSDASGTGSVFARLAQIASFTDTVESTLANINTSAIDSKIGTNSDASGTSTIFARLKMIYDAVDTVEATLSNIKAKTDLIGTSSDLVGTGTVFARLAQIAEYTDGVKAKTNLIGTASDPAGTSTIFARLAQIAGFVDNVESVLGVSGQSAGTTTVMGYLKRIEGFVDGVETYTNRIGAASDSASASTLFGKIADLKSHIAANSGTDVWALVQPRVFRSTTNVTNTDITLVDITGKGVLRKLDCRVATMTIIIDGVEYTGDINYFVSYLSLSTGFVRIGVSGDMHIYGMIPFKSNLKIIVNAGGSYSGEKHLVEYTLE